MENKSIKCNRITPIIKVADYCNFTCSFCRYSNNSRKSLMPFSVFRTIIEKACDYNIANGINELDIIFHGGEPLLWGYDNFVSAIKLQKEFIYKHPKFIFNNSIQTNGSLLTDRWIDFLIENNFDIGISIDGPEEINFHRGYKGDKNVLENIDKLSQKNCKFGILSVITNDHAGWADKYYDFLIEHNIHSVGLCYCMYDEKNKITVSNEILTDFLKCLFTRYFEGTYQLEIREFNNIFKMCYGISTGACSFSKRQSCGNFFSIRSNGNVFFCDPYALDVQPLGNILSETFFDIKSNPDLLKIIISAKEGAQKVCGDCEINNICGGGCYRATFLDGRNAFCETFKNFYPYVVDVFHSFSKKMKSR